MQDKCNENCKNTPVFLSSLDNEIPVLTIAGSCCTRQPAPSLPPRVGGSALTAPVGNPPFNLRKFKPQLVKVRRRMLSRSSSGRLGKKSPSANNRHIWTGFAKPGGS